MTESPTRPDRDCPMELSARQRQVLSLAAQGCTRRAIAARLGVKASTVREHLAIARQKLGAVNVTHAVAIALTMGVIRYGGSDGHPSLGV